MTERPEYVIRVRMTAPRRFVAEVLGTHLWSAGPTPESAVGSLMLTQGGLLGLSLLRADDEPAVRVGRC